jgi:hypothetical protein
MLATDGTWREAVSTRGQLRGDVRAVFIASLVFLLGIGVFLCARRLNGTLAAPLTPVSLIAIAAVLLLWACAIRLRLRDRHFVWLPAIVLALFAIACSYPAERGIDWLVWLTVFAVYGLLPATRRSPAIAPSSPTDVVLQQLSRSRTAEGVEVVRGTLVAEFAPSERSATLHVAFCPPFERLPEIDIEPADGPDCDAKVAQLLHQGARIEVRLSRASTSLEQVTIEFVATDANPLAV